MRLPRNDWYAYTDTGFQRIGQCTLEIARSQSKRMFDNVYLLLTAQQLPQLKSRVDQVIAYHEDLEEEHTENMRHDAETDFLDIQNPESEDDDE